MSTQIPQHVLVCSSRSSLWQLNYYTVVEACSVDEKTSTLAFGGGPFHTLTKNTRMLSWFNQVTGCASSP